jgi:hypothetical protein
VFPIETKTLSKPTVGDAKVRFDGTTLMVGSHVLDRDPLVQARAQATWMRRTLEELPSYGRSNGAGHQDPRLVTARRTNHVTEASQASSCRTWV